MENNKIQVFENSEFGKVEVLMIGDKPYFPAVECAVTLGYKKPHDAVMRHCKASVKYGVLTNGGIQEKNYIPEGDLYRLIIRSKLPAAVRFEAWVCDEVLPSIRNHGAYINEEILRRMQDDREFADDLIRRLAAERNKNKELRENVAQLAPKARYFDIILCYPNAVQVSIIAKDYGMTAVKFNKLLRELGLQFKIGKTWLLYKKYADKGYTVTNTYAVNDRLISIHTCFTQKGRCWLYLTLKANGILPMIEQAQYEQMQLDEV